MLIKLFCSWYMIKNKINLYFYWNNISYRFIHYFIPGTPKPIYCYSYLNILFYYLAQVCNWVTVHISH